MPGKPAIEQAHRDHLGGKSAYTLASKFVREESDLFRKGAHGVRYTRQAIVIGLSKDRRAGFPLPLQKSGRVSEKTRHNAMLVSAKSRMPRTKPVSRRRFAAFTRAARSQ
ncbi:transcription elongation factor [Prosthecobacter sp.]|uniref:transcription elongation factor n=1 Tax=Prosthecobacter sp. TaxID=1965333 RepID=UPI003784C24B